MNIDNELSDSKETKDRKTKYKVQSKIGEGTYGEVYKAMNKLGETVAIKKIRNVNEFKSRGGFSTSVLREISNLKAFRHRNLVRLKDHIVEPEALYLVFEFVQFDLKTFLDRYKYKLPINPHNIIYQMLKGIEFLHINSIVHRDIKPQNILIDVQGRVKIADFGLTRTVHFPNGGMTPEVITLWYRAPECLMRNQIYDFSVDIYSIGCIVYELYHFKPLVEGQSEINQLYNLFKILGPPKFDGTGSPANPEIAKNFKRSTLSSLNKHMDEKTFDLFEQMVKVDPENRISAEHAIIHPIFLKFR